VKQLIEENKVKLLGWMRALSIIVGLASLIVGFSVLIFPGLGMLFLAYLLSVGLIFVGFERLVVGVSGEIYSPILSQKVTEGSKQFATQ
jgi:uncharacterized membrane protein HdeD (DUF308 family)